MIAFEKEEKPTYDFSQLEEHEIKPQAQTRQVNEAIERLCKLLYHEKCSPAILPYQKDLIEGTYADGKMTSLGLLELVQQQDEGIQGMKNRIDEEHDKQIVSLYLHLHVMELEKVKYMLKEYLRVRLRKIEQFGMYILNNDMDALLSHPERIYLKKYVDLRTQHFMKLCLEKYPKSVRYFGLMDKNVDSQREKNKELIQVPAPNHQRLVMVRISTTRPITLGQTQLKKGDILLLQYSEVKKILDQSLDYMDIL